MGSGTKTHQLTTPNRVAPRALVQDSSPLVSVTRLDSLVHPFGDEVETARTMAGWDEALLRSVVARAYGIPATYVDAHVEVGPDRAEYLVVELKLPPGDDAVRRAADQSNDPPPLDPCR